MSDKRNQPIKRPPSNKTLGGTSTSVVNNASITDNKPLNRKDTPAVRLSSQTDKKVEPQQITLEKKKIQKTQNWR